MTILKSMLLLCSCILFAYPTFSQVSEVLYKLEYDENTELYDCKIVIHKGSANTVLERVQLNSQYSIVVPTGAEVSIVESYLPLRYNQTFEGTEPTEWYLASTVAHPEAEPECDYYGIIPILSPVGYHNVLNEGDEVTLFSMKITSDDICDRNVRLYNIEIDPLSSSPGMMGGDFRNGVSIGGPSQLYIGNEAPAEEMRASMDDVQLCNGDCMILAPEIECLAFPLMYQWSTGEQTSAIEVCPIVSTTYALTITDGNGETAIIENEIKVVEGEQYGCNGVATSTANLAAGVTVFPNPVQDQLYFDCNYPQESISLVDVNGVVLQQQEQTSSGVFAMEHLSAGTYILVVNDGKNIATKRVVKGE